MDPARRAELAARLRECGESEMIELLESHLEDLDAEAVRLALRNPHASRRVIDLVFGERRLLGSHMIQRALAQHPKTPVAKVLNLVPALYWNDLVELGGNARVRPRVRLAANRRLVERLPRLGPGERVAIARKAGPGAIARLLHDQDPRVLGALLENPRMTEGLLAPVIHADAARAETLDMIATNSKWGLRYSIRSGVALNPRAGVKTALALLSYLKKSDLRAVWRDRRIAGAVRAKAGLLLGIDPGGGRGVI